jgi:hypothetical protein
LPGPNFLFWRGMEGRLGLLLTWALKRLLPLSVVFPYSNTDVAGKRYSSPLQAAILHFEGKCMPNHAPAVPAFSYQFSGHPWYLPRYHWFSTAPLGVASNEIHLWSSNQKMTGKRVYCASSQSSYYFHKCRDHRSFSFPWLTVLQFIDSLLPLLPTVQDAQITHSSWFINDPGYPFCQCSGSS